LHQLHGRQLRRRRHQHVDVVGRYRSPYDDHVPRLADLSNQVARTLCYAAAQNLVPVFRDPDDMVFEIVCRVRAMPIFRHLFIVEE
jgi:hypothetical protein